VVSAAGGVAVLPRDAGNGQGAVANVLDDGRARETLRCIFASENQAAEVDFGGRHEEERVAADDSTAEGDRDSRRVTGNAVGGKDVEDSALHTRNNTPVADSLGVVDGLLGQVPDDWEGEGGSGSDLALRQRGVVALEQLVASCASIHLGDQDVCLARYHLPARVSRLDVPKVNWATAGDGKVNGSTQADDLVIRRDERAPISECGSLVLVDTGRGGKSNRLQDAVRIGNGLERPEAGVDVRNPQNAASSPAAICCDCRLPYASSAGRRSRRLASKREERLPAGVGSKLVRVSIIADRGEVKVSPLQRITSGTAKDRVGSRDGLDDVVRTSGSLLEASQILGVEHINLGVLADGHSNPADAGRVER